MAGSLRSTDQLAALLGVHPQWIREQCRDGKLPHRRIGRRLRFSDDDVDAIVAAAAVPTRPALEVVDGDVTTRRPTARRRYARYPL